MKDFIVAILMRSQVIIPYIISVSDPLILL